VPRTPHIRHALGVHLICRFEIAGRPGCKAQQRRSAASGQMIVFEGEAVRSAGMLRCLGEVAACQGITSTVQGYGTG
jgi:hypothetical protein